MRDTIRIAPPVTSLPILNEAGALEAQVVTENRVLFMVTIVDVHAYVYLYECLRVARKRTMEYPMPALHAFLCLPPRGDAALSDGSMHKILGPLSERHEIVNKLETKFGKTMTSEQQHIVLTADKACINIDSVAGGGKTFLLLMFAWCAITRTQDDDEKTIIWLAAPTNNMALKLFNDMVEVLGSDQAVAHVGLDRATNDDRLDTKIMAEARAATAAETHALKCLDAIIHALTKLLSATTAAPAVTQDTLCKVLALRHEYLDSHMYQQIREAQTEALLNIRVAVSTTTYLMKMQTDAASYWGSRLLKWKRKFLGIDESHRQGWEPVAAMMAMFDCTMLTGDSFQEQPIHSKQDIYRDPMRTN
jgi:hypothetical protein